ncbi:unnamed protein product [Lasius platythorax]|uniref:Uncharacterized protein n=1 Tax=Lasius platythorax TaxID=488582 RepID=A0AAV2P7E3_9HYME
MNRTSEGPATFSPAFPNRNRTRLKSLIRHATITRGYETRRGSRIQRIVDERRSEGNERVVVQPLNACRKEHPRKE